MSESYGASVGISGDTFQNNKIYIYKGGKVDENDKQTIEHVHIDDSVSVIDARAFYESEKLQTVKFSKNNTTTKKIGNEVFNGCCNLLSINLQDTQIETIGNDAFNGCFQLATIQFPSSIRQIGKSCFQMCDRLMVVELSHANDLETMEEAAFYNCSALKTINLPPTLSRIGRYSFYGCEALETIDLRETCTAEIGEDTFQDCIKLATIHFPTTTSRIGKSCFRRCRKLISLDLQTTSVERLEEYAFHSCSSLTSVNFPKTLKFIGKYGFCSSTKLEYLNLDETSIEEIGDGAFFNCKNLTTVVGMYTHQDTMDDDDDEMFQYGHVKLPASLVNIGMGCFSSCPILYNRIDNNSIHYQCDINRGGRRFLQRQHHHHQGNDSTHGNRNKRSGKVYFSSLWPLILYRVLNNMELPRQTICPNDDNLSLYTTAANPLQRRASVAYYLLVHGVIPDLQPSSQPGNVQMQKKG